MEFDHHARMREMPHAIDTRARHFNDERATSTANGAILASPSHIYIKRGYVM